MAKDNIVRRKGYRELTVAEYVELLRYPLDKWQRQLLDNLEMVHYGKGTKDSQST